MLNVIINQFKHLNSLQKEIGVRSSKLYEVQTITFDLTSANTGKFHGLGTILNQYRQQVWLVDKQ